MHEKGQYAKISTEEVDRFLTERGQAQMICGDGEEVCTIPIEYKRDGKFLVGSLSFEAALRLLKKNSLVSIQSDLQLDQGDWISVVGIGRCELLPEIGGVTPFRILLKNVAGHKSVSNQLKTGEQK